MGLLDSLSGLVGENLATEVLVHLLNSDSDFVQFQKLFFLRVISFPISRRGQELEIVTQKSFDEGRPDFLGISRDSVFLFEAKLGSPLSGEDQLVRYVNTLKDPISLLKSFEYEYLPENPKKILVFIAPQKTIIASELMSDKVSKEQFQCSFNDLCVRNSVQFVNIAWETILDDLDRNNPLQRELHEFVSKYVEQEFSEEDIVLLKNQDIPKAMKKLFSQISAFRTKLNIPGVKQGRMSQSCNYYGFCIDHPSFGLWFGFFFEHWARTGNPTFLQVRENPNEWEMEKIKGIAKTLNFEKTETDGMILAIPFDQTENWNSQVKMICDSFVKEMAEEVQAPTA